MDRGPDARGALVRLACEQAKVDATARRIFAALTPSDRSDLMTEMVYGTGEARLTISERFYAGKEVPAGVMAALAKLIAYWED